jgi:hypothetical protein
MFKPRATHVQHDISASRARARVLLVADALLVAALVHNLMRA